MCKSGSKAMHIPVLRLLTKSQTVWVLLVALLLRSLEILAHSYGPSGLRLLSSRESSSQSYETIRIVGYFRATLTISKVRKTTQLAKIVICSREKSRAALSPEDDS